MTDETLKLVAELKQATEALKTTADEQIKKYDVLNEEKMNKINTRIDDLSDLLKKQASKKSRAALSDEQAEKTEIATKNFTKFIVNGDKAVTDEERKSFSISVNGDGGFLLQPELRSAILARVQETSDIRMIANVSQTNANEVDIPIIINKIDSGWTGERSSRPETNSSNTFGSVKISIQELYAKPSVTQRFLDTISNGEATVLDLIAQSIALTENTAFVSGNGIAKPTGFLANTVDSTAASPASFSATNVEAMKSGTNGSFTADNLIELLQRLKSQYKKNACWLMNRETFAAVRKFKSTTTGAYMWEPSYQAGQPSLLLGFPVYEANDMPVAATGSLSVAFGDFKTGYEIVDGKNLSILRDPYSNKPYVDFYTTKDVGGAVKVAEAIKVLKLAA